MTLLEANKVRHFFGGLCAVADFNLDLHAGELMGIIGPNGAGKTTVFNLITGVYQASEGSIRFKGTELVGKTPHQITALRIGRTFQNIGCSAICRCWTTCGSLITRRRITRRWRRCYISAAIAARSSGSLRTRNDYWPFQAGGPGRRDCQESTLRPAAAAGNRPGAGHRAGICCCWTSRRPG